MNFSKGTQFPDNPGGLNTIAARKTIQWHQPWQITAIGLALRLASEGEHLETPNIEELGRDVAMDQYLWKYNF